MRFHTHLTPTATIQPLTFWSRSSSTTRRPGWCAGLVWRMTPPTAPCSIVPTTNPTLVSRHTEVNI